MQNERTWAVAGLVVCALAWAGNALVARATAGDLPPIGLSFWRWTTAMALLLPFTFRGLRQYRGVLIARWRHVVILAA